MIRWLLLSFFFLTPKIHSLYAADLESNEAGVVDIPAPSTNSEIKAWQPVEDVRGTSLFAKALDTWLTGHPHGVRAARALLERARLQENLLEAGADLRRARGEGLASIWGARASLELAKLEYAQERTESALMALEDAETWPRTEDMEPEWLYWRGQCRFVLKGFERAKADFERLIAGYRQNARIPAARLGLAACDAALHADEKALAGFEQLYGDAQCPFGAQALWGAAVLRQRQGQRAEAKKLFLRLRNQYPASFESSAAQKHLADISQGPLVAPNEPVKVLPKKLGVFQVQVGAFAKRNTAVNLQKKLKSRHYPAFLQMKKGARTLYFVKVGPYKSRGAAEKIAKKLETSDRLPQRIIEE